MLLWKSVEAVKKTVPFLLRRCLVAFCAATSWHNAKWPDFSSIFVTTYVP